MRMPEESEPQVCILHEILHAVQHQRVGDVVLFGVFRHIALEKAQVENMDLRIVLHGELGKRVAVGILDAAGACRSFRCRK